jgi:hypothetical protein
MGQGSSGCVQGSWCHPVVITQLEPKETKKSLVSLNKKQEKTNKKHYLGPKQHLVSFGPFFHVLHHLLLLLLSHHCCPFVAHCHHFVVWSSSSIPVLLLLACGAPICMAVSTWSSLGLHCCCCCCLLLVLVIAIIIQSAPRN